MPPLSSSYKDILCYGLKNDSFIEHAVHIFSTDIHLPLSNEN